MRITPQNVPQPGEGCSSVRERVYTGMDFLGPSQLTSTLLRVRFRVLVALVRTLSSTPEGTLLRDTAPPLLLLVLLSSLVACLIAAPRCPWVHRCFLLFCRCVCSPPLCLRECYWCWRWPWCWRCTHPLTIISRARPRTSAPSRAATAPASAHSLVRTATAAPALPPPLRRRLIFRS